MCTWYQTTAGQRSLIDFVVVSSDLRPHVFYTLNISGEVGDMESKWTMVKASIEEATVKSCAQKVSIVAAI